ncbi:MAG: hypothetical protein ABIV06_00405 [Thermoanaerobaculia bacterium]
MSDSLPSTPAVRVWLGVATLGLALVGGASAQSPGPAAHPPARSVVAPQTGAPGESAGIRLMVFSLERKPVFEALTVVRPLLSVQGSVELDPNRNTIAVRDNLAALSRVATAIRAFDHENLPVRIDVSLIRAEIAKISPIPPDTGIEPDLLTRLRQLMRFETFSLLAHGEIASREGEAVAYEMAEGYRLNFELGSVADGKRIRLTGFRIVRALPGQPERELVRSVVNLGLEQPLILGLTRDEASDRALLLVLRYQSATPLVAGR